MKKTVIGKCISSHAIYAVNNNKKKALEIDVESNNKSLVRLVLAKM